MTEVIGRADHPRLATFGGIGGPATAPAAGGPDFAAVQASAEFAVLRARFRRFVFGMTGLFLCWYLGYVLLAAYAHEFMAIRLTGSITVGLVLGLAQFGTTALITAVYLRWARRKLDPAVAELRESTGAGR
ncbi:DUF485 domain-containing protein [Actinokineospora inagensis]|uniref:DUF485 domain-containing protein n=1 Tax=Actinokineospora inagensis TaxID=103730 RepID=UPI00041F180C|nr:DUF485 domain-containing protein [Actinokineospora inagensis]